MSSFNEVKNHLFSLIRMQNLPIECSLPMFSWAYCVVNTRNFQPNVVQLEDGLDDELVLVPMFDLFGHSPYVGTKVETDMSKDAFNLMTSSSTKRYDQVSGFSQVAPLLGLLHWFHLISDLSNWQYL